MIDTRNGAARLLDFLPDQELPNKSLAELTASKARKPSLFPVSSLQKRVERASIIPLSALDCGQCRMLVGQRFGLRWLARPVAVFVSRYPFAECDLYPGDLSVNALRAWRDFDMYAPKETALMIGTDFVALEKEASDDDDARSIVREAIAALTEARTALL